MNWLIVAKRFVSIHTDMMHLQSPDFFSKRFGDDKKVLTLIAAVLSLYSLFLIQLQDLLHVESYFQAYSALITLLL